MANNLLQSGAAWLGRKLQASAGRSVSLTDGTTTLAISGVVAMHEHTVIDAEGFPTKVLVFDWTLVTADLGAFVLGRGCKITDEDGVIYEAMALGNKPCVERADTSGVMQTLHTKRVGG